MRKLLQKEKEDFKKYTYENNIYVNICNTHCNKIFISLKKSGLILSMQIGTQVFQSTFI